MSRSQRTSGFLRSSNKAPPPCSISYYYCRSHGGATGSEKWNHSRRQIGNTGSVTTRSPGVIAVKFFVLAYRHKDNRYIEMKKTPQYLIMGTLRYHTQRYFREQI
jgi:hypothetical protein